MKFSWLIVVFLFSKESVLASIDAYPFPNEELTDRYEQLISELRCPQCLNTNLAGSDAMIAQDLGARCIVCLLKAKPMKKF